jgi:hypothetical protein
VPRGWLSHALRQLAPQLGPRVRGAALPLDQRERPRRAHRGGREVCGRGRVLLRGHQHIGPSVRHSRHNCRDQEQAKYIIKSHVRTVLFVISSKFEYLKAVTRATKISTTTTPRAETADCEHMCHNHTLFCTCSQCYVSCQFSFLRPKYFQRTKYYLKNCEHNTYGKNCEFCIEGYVGDATRGTPYDCVRGKINRQKNTPNF